MNLLSIQLTSIYRLKYSYLNNIYYFFDFDIFYFKMQRNIISSTHVRSDNNGKITSISTITNIITGFKQNYDRAKEYQSYIDDLGPGEIDFGNGDTRLVYHPCDRQRNEKALDNIVEFHQRELDRSSRSSRLNRRSK